MSVRPTKKQRELLDYIDTFITANGYSPSFREIMRARNYKSVSTVAAHVDALVVRGHLRKRDNSARTLEVISDKRRGSSPKTTNEHLDWLRQEIVDRESNPDAALEVEILRAALTLLDQSGD
jgi:repressor LexA